MAYEKERGAFIEIMRAEGVPPGVSESVLRNAQSIQTCAERECSDESADRDRVRCPEGDDCLCLGYGSFDSELKQHGTVPRIAVKSARAERRIVAALEPFNVTPVFNGDPRGACVKLRVPSGRTDDWGNTGICVPTR